LQIQIKNAKDALPEPLSSRDSIIEVQVLRNQLTDDEPAQADEDENVEDIVMEYTVPTKVSFKSDW